MGKAGNTGDRKNCPLWGAEPKFLIYGGMKRSDKTRNRSDFSRRGTTEELVPLSLHACYTPLYGIQVAFSTSLPYLLNE